MRGKFNLTNESIRGKFQSNFELVNYAIGLVEVMVKTGRAPRVHIDIENPAVQVIEEILTGKDRFEIDEIEFEASEKESVALGGLKDIEDEDEEEVAAPKKGRKETAKK